MKACAFLLLLAGLFLLGCKKQDSSAKPTNAPTSSGNPLTAPADYGSALVRGQKIASKTVDTVGVNQAVKMFYATEGRYPKSLQELVPDHISRLPDPPAGMKFDYNPATGEVKVVPK